MDEKKRIGRDLHNIVTAVLLYKPPEGVEPEKVGGWRWGWLMHCVWGYAQTELGVWHPSGEDGTLWREEAAEAGLDLGRVDGLTGPERKRDEAQREMYAEAMAPGLVSKMVDGMKARPGAAAPKHNGGQRCDMDDGPCACGAWHLAAESTPTGKG